MPWALLDFHWALPALSLGPRSTLSHTGLATSWTLVASVAIWTQVSYQEALNIGPTHPASQKRLQTAERSSSQPERGSSSRPKPSLVLPERFLGAWASLTAPGVLTLRSYNPGSGP